jgi:hypothetical protein
VSQNQDNLVIGKIYLPNSPGTPVGKFDFILEKSNSLNIEIGNMVTGVTEEGIVVGIINDLRVLGNSGSPLEVELSNLYPGDRLDKVSDIAIASVQVYYSEFLRPVRSGFVRNATVAEVALATGLSKVSWPIAAGSIKLSSGEYAPISLDGSALLGPESAHLMIGGLSGQAAKTSYAGVLLKSALNSGSRSGKKIAALVFNVKGEDLIWIDQNPSKGYEISDEDRKIYESMGLDPSPFENVTVYAPALPGNHGTRSPRSDAVALKWDLVQIWPYLKYFFPWMHDDEKLSAFLSEFSDICLKSKNPVSRIDTFGKLNAWFDEILQNGEGAESSNPIAWRSHHIATLRRVRRMLTTLPSRCGGLLIESQSKSTDDLQLPSIVHNSVHVIDIANMPLDVQSVVIAKTLEKLLRASEDGLLDIDNLVVFIDELNTWAPGQGSESSSIKKILQRISTQGRYAGISLWGCGQKLSKVDEMVRDNAATRALGVSPESEINSGIYGKISVGVSERLATLPKGQMHIWHYLFRSSIAVNFPRPAWRTGRGISQEPKEMTGIEKKYINKIKETIPDNYINEALSNSTNEKEFKEIINDYSLPDMKERALHEKNGFDLENPYDL